MLKRIFFKFKEKEIYHDIIESLVAALEAKDTYTSGHSERVAFMSYELAKALGVKGIELENIHIAAHLHDIGKIGVPDQVLNKNGELLPNEWEYIKMHPKIGFNILGKSKKLKSISNIVLYHHERWDGKGYPEGISGLRIPLGSRIIAICDSIDAMMSDRPYRKSIKFENCMNEIIKNKELMFDPLIVDYIIKNMNSVKKFIDTKSDNLELIVG
ncbi:HD-GYP domain-containing protein [Clostridium cylindrosporum]|uniref:Cyclic di-GMP phosphodiesterase response regulator RpfG n=1 Tax=Clostridium cylindrosporum DSM 605 TaxID=1121307 RepID=A0A0J8D9N4_CLOCY|nr:HD domain-containing phosphohydrolase [Clostridium cylindrosporum]KMT21019.1 cyclic di-GMP phosphodiesterase response regulator RpfG [Clostridium cylindrosporum DSM 605]